MSLFEELLGKHQGRARHGHHHDDHRPRFGTNEWGGGFNQPGQHDWNSQHRGGHGDWESEHAHDSSSRAAPLLALAMRHKGVVIAIALLALVVLLAAVAVLVSLLPVLAQGLGFLGENGIKGMLDKFAPILNLLWSGSGK